MAQAQFLFVCCQCGAEVALKQEVERQWPALRFAYSRPGFVTYKCVGDKPLPASLDLRSVFARTYGFTIGEVKADNLDQMARAACEQVAGQRFDQLHVWPRDSAEPGHRGFVPGPTEYTDEVAQVIREQAIVAESISPKVRINSIARTDQKVLDVVVLEQGQWWLGQHTASSRILRQPGGIFSVRLPEDSVSRAYLKMSEALAWSQFPLSPGDKIVEIGSAPGGASQALLERDLIVTGVDPSDMHERILEHPNFTHIRKRGADLKRREYEEYRWLSIDTNVAPNYALDTVEAIVNHPTCHLRGMLLTLKLVEWSLAEHIPDYIERIRSWGFEDIRARQLTHNRQEICVSVLRSKSDRRLSKSQRKHQAIKNRRRTAGKQAAANSGSGP